jgi:hypothetical protein
MASVAEQWAEQAEGVAADVETAAARLRQKLAELQAELQVRCRWIHSVHGSGSGATPPVCLSWCPHTPAHSGHPRTAPRRGHAFSLWSGCGVFGAYPGWAGHAGGLQAPRWRLSEAERAEQLHRRLRAEEGAAAAAAAAAEEEVVVAEVFCILLPNTTEYFSQLQEVGAERQGHRRRGAVVDTVVVPRRTRQATKAIELAWVSECFSIRRRQRLDVSPLCGVKRCPQNEYCEYAASAIYIIHVFYMNEI